MARARTRRSIWCNRIAGRDRTDHCDERGALLGSYDRLTVSATYDEVTLPESHVATNVLRVPAGVYRGRILQMKDPEVQVDDAWVRRGIHFVIEFVPDTGALAPETRIPWADM